MSPVFSEVHGGGYGRRQKRGGRFVVIIIVLLLIGGGVYFFLTKDSSLPLMDKIRPSSSETAGRNDDLLMPDLAPTLSSETSTFSAPTTEYTVSARTLFSDAKSAADLGKLEDARENLYKMLTSPLPPSVEAEVIKMLGDINIQMTVSPLMTPEKEYYVIQSGDYLARIAKKYNTTVALIKKMNNLSSDTIRLGERLLVCNGTFNIKASKSTHTLDLMLNGRLFKRYLIGTGKQGRTPTATFTVIDKIIEPPWYRPDGKKIEFGDPENVLGTRWMAIESADHPELRGFGIHGTWERDSVGTASSAGCLRLLNEEVEELFDLVPRKTTVVIVD